VACVMLISTGHLFGQIGRSGEDPIEMAK